MNALTERPYAASSDRTERHKAAYAQKRLKGPEITSYVNRIAAQRAALYASQVAHVECTLAAATLSSQIPLQRRCRAVLAVLRTAYHYWALRARDWETQVYAALDSPQGVEKPPTPATAAPPTEDALLDQLLQ